MMLLHRFRLIVLTLSVLLATAAFATPVRAGTFQIRDEAHVLAPADAARVRSALGGAAFDGRLVVTTDYPDAPSLSRYLRSLVNEPNLVVVGLDPEHRHVEVRFGSGTHIQTSAWTAIERAGNDAFRHGDWATGVAAIFGAAARAVGSDTAGDLPQGAPAIAARPSFAGPAILILLLAGVIGVGVYFARRRAKYGAPGSGYGGGYGPPGPSYGGGYPGGPAAGGMGPLGGGLIGAGLGGLAGYELGKLEGERVERDHDRGGFGGGSEPMDRDGNYDAGGGGSSWDSDGGGFDAGGGGGDGGGDGGGGSDF